MFNVSLLDHHLAYSGVNTANEITLFQKEQI